MEREELTPENLYRYLRSVQLAATVENEKAAAGPTTEQAREQRSQCQGAAMLAAELISRYRLGPRPEEH